MSKLLLPRDPSHGLIVVDPLSLPFATLGPRLLEFIDLELVEMIRRRRRMDRRDEPRNLATYSRCCFISPGRDRRRTNETVIDERRAEPKMRDRVNAFQDASATIFRCDTMTCRLSMRT